MFIYNFKSYKSWKDLPWKQINERIFILQNKIYKASRECDQKSVKYNQSILINSLEAKLKCIEDINKFIYKYYLIYNSEIYNSTEIYKKSILLCLLNKKNPFNYYITDKVKQNILYLCIQPEWQAKLEPSISKYLTNFAPKILDSRVNKYNLGKLCSIFNITSNTKYLDINYLLAKIQSSLPIDSIIKVWMKEQSIIEPLKYSYLNKYNTNYSCYNLYKLICYITYCGIEWFTLTKVFYKPKEYNKLKMVNISISNIYELSIIYTAKNKFIFDDYFFFFRSISLIVRIIRLNLRYTKYRCESKKYILKSYTKTIKMKMYKKDFLGRLRPNTKLSFIGSINKIHNSFGLFCKEYKIHFNDAEFVELCRIMDCIINSWLRKKYKSQKKIWYTANLLKNYR
uniref:Reverse transcriptase N-terminal domain-containing protein n=1 Tax=Gelidium coulteri TaxID=28849 RepID=A0A411FRR3_9FLOR|nr:hypothetical protein [Gelidium coulteri]QBA96183.1 hypothetical protein [Gelidium coulteri]